MGFNLGGAVKTGLNVLGMAKGIGKLAKMAKSPSALAHFAKCQIIDMEGEVKRSEFYLTNLDPEEELRFCMTPEKVKVQTSTRFRSYNIVELGELKIPKGEQLTRISWEGILPGAGILMYPFVTHEIYEDPQELLKVFKRWRGRGSKLKLLITQTPLNLEVYMDKFDWEASGGLGDYKYSIELVAAKDLIVRTVEEADKFRQEQKDTYEEELKNREKNKSKAGKRIKKIDDIYSVVKLVTGSGDFGDILNVAGMAGLDLGGMKLSAFKPANIIGGLAKGVLGKGFNAISGAVGNVMGKAFGEKIGGSIGKIAGGLAVKAATKAAGKIVNKVFKKIF